MSRSVPTRLILGAALAASATLLLPGCSTPTKPADAAPPASADAAGNFGFPLGFSPSKMDTTADPRQDFRRYAGGRWLDAAKIPADKLEISGYLVMQDTVQTQLRDLLQEAARTSGAAPRGSPAQQVGDFYASGMDVARLKSLGVQPLASEFDRIAKVQGPTALAEEVARLQMMTGGIGDTGRGGVAASAGPHADDDLPRRRQPGARRRQLSQARRPAHPRRLRRDDRGLPRDRGLEARGRARDGAEWCSRSRRGWRRRSSRRSRSATRPSASCPCPTPT